jgi:hypothetical protein
VDNRVGRFVQQLFVLLIVIAAALLAAWRLLGATTRVRLLEALSHALGEPAFIKRRVSRQRAALLQAGCAACPRNRQR